MNQGIWLKNEKTGKYYLKRVYNHKFVQKFADKVMPITMQVVVLLGVGTVVASIVIACFIKTSFFSSGGPIIDLGKMIKKEPNGEVVMNLAVTLFSIGLTIVGVSLQYYLNRINNEGANTKTIFIRFAKLALFLYIATWTLKEVTSKTIFKSQFSFCLFLLWLISLCAYLSWLFFDLIKFIYQWTLNEGQQMNKGTPSLEKMRFLWAIVGVVIGWIFARS